MALPVNWYDFVCFGIVGASFLGSLWVLWRKEIASRHDYHDSSTTPIIYESLLVARPESDGFVDAMPSNHVSSGQLWTSCWKGVHPGCLLATRFVSFFVLGGFLLWDLSEWSASTLVMYYTEWTYALVMLYFALASVTSAYGIWFASNENGEFLTRDVEDITVINSISYREKGINNGKIKLQSHYAEEAIRSRAGIWGYLMQTIYQTCAGAVILTDFVFWCIIVPFGSNAHLGLNLLMGCLHTLNAVFMVLDTALNNLPFPWFRLAYFVQWSCLYVVFQWIVHACGLTWWPYPFLELDIPWAPFWYFALAVVHIPCYGIYALIVKAKNSFFPRWFPHAFLRSY